MITFELSCCTFCFCYNKAMGINSVKVIPHHPLFIFTTHLLLMGVVFISEQERDKREIKRKKREIERNGFD